MSVCQCGKLSWVEDKIGGNLFGFVRMSGEGWGEDNPSTHIWAYTE